MNHKAAKAATAQLLLSPLSEHRLDAPTERSHSADAFAPSLDGPELSQPA